MASEAASYTTTTKVSFADAPPKPEVLRLQLRDRKSLWEKFYETVRDFTPEQLIAAVSTEQERIMANVRKNGQITEEEAEFLNKTIEQNIRKVLDDFHAKAMDALKIKPGDTPEEIELKLSFTEKLSKWLCDVFNWVLKMEEIFQWVKKKINWCWQKTRELFDYLFSLISS